LTGFSYQPTKIVLRRPLESAAEPSILLVQTACRQPARAKAASAFSTPG
jgi:hypothetical protein